MKLELTDISLDDLRPAEYNPRQINKDELSKLTNNLEEFGLVDPIIIDLKDQNTIIGGHQRYKALQAQADKHQSLKLLPLGDIGWVLEDTNLKVKDKQHQKALNISLNKISGDWEYNKLTHLLDELQTSNFQTTLTGFDEIELESFNITEKVQLDNTIFDEKYFAKPKHNDIYKNQQEQETGETEEEEPEVHHKCPKCGYTW